MSQPPPAMRKGIVALHPPPSLQARAVNLAPRRSPQRFRPQCTHLTMTRLYGWEFVCDNCRRPGGFGWVFRCTQDREDVIEESIDTGRLTTFDDLGEEMVDLVGERERGPKARQNELSFFDEVTPEQLASYSPEQLKTILQQRQNVHDKAAQDIDAAIRRSQTSTEPQEELFDGNPHEDGPSDRPWLRNHTRPCEYTICPRCRPGAADRAYLSLNAIADGEIAPTAAVGYGFHAIGFRPVVDAEILRNIGDKEQMVARRNAAIQDQSASSSSATSILAMLDSQIAQANALLEMQNEENSKSLPVMPETPTLNQEAAGKLKHSPRIENLSAYSSPRRLIDHGHSIRAPWTPPPSPTPLGWETSEDIHAVGLAAMESICDGRSSNSLKVNRSMRSQVLTSHPSTNALHKLGQSDCGSQTTPYLDEEEYDVGLTLPLHEETFEKACQTVIGEPDLAEERDLLGNQPLMMKGEESVGGFLPEPLEVGEGVAVSEESVEVGVPDVVTQV